MEKQEQELSAKLSFTEIMVPFPIVLDIIANLISEVKNAVTESQDKHLEVSATSTLLKVQEALCNFIIKTAEEGTTGNTVQVLPEVVKALVELSKITHLQK